VGGGPGSWRGCRGVGDDAYHGRALAAPVGEATPANATHPGADTMWTTRLPHNVIFYALAPPPIGKPGRSRLKGDSKRYRG
jgi:hypothetical protein